MKKILVITIAVLAMAALTLSVSAACAASKVVAMTSNAFATGLSGTPANVYGRLWSFTNGAASTSGRQAAVDGGAGCANVGTTNNDFWNVSGCTAGGYGIYAGDLSSASQWATGCPANSDRIAVLLEDTTGKYRVGSLLGDGSGFWDTDTMATGAAVNYPTITNITMTSPVGSNPIVFTLNAITGVPANAYGVSGTGGNPGTPVITGYRLYYQNAAAPPTTVLPGAWTLCTNGAISGYNPAPVANISAPLPGAGTTMYLLLSMTFESGYETFYAPSIYTAFGPTAAGVFASQHAALDNGQVSVNWQSNVETDVAAYQLSWSMLQEGPYRPIAGTYSPKGNSSTYTASFPSPSAKPFYVKVTAVMTNGTEEESQLMRVGVAGTTGLAR